MKLMYKTESQQQINVNLTKILFELFFPAACSPCYPQVHNVAKDDPGFPIPPDSTSECWGTRIEPCAFYKVLGSTPGIHSCHADGLCTGRQCQVSPPSFNCMISLTSRHFTKTNFQIRINETEKLL